MTERNTTELKPFQAMEREIIHRDMLAHQLRWVHALRHAEPNMNILDWGCGSGGLAETFYRNRFKPKRFLGLEYRNNTVKKLEREFPWAEFKQADLTKPQDVGNDWDLICSFEVLEHVHKKNGRAFLDNVCACMNEKTVLLLSTPNFDPRVSAAGNHTYDGLIHEYDHDELQGLLEERFIVEAKFGTFASKKDYYHALNEHEKALWDKLHAYYDSVFMSIIFAPLFPSRARNCLWRLRKRV